MYQGKISILGINIQLSSINSTKAELKTLAMVELTEKHSAAYLKEKVRVPNLHLRILIDNIHFYLFKLFYLTKYF